MTERAPAEFIFCRVVWVVVFEVYARWWWLGKCGLGKNRGIWDIMLVGGGEAILVDCSA